MDDTQIEKECPDSNGNFNQKMSELEIDDSGSVERRQDANDDAATITHEYPTQDYLNMTKEELDNQYGCSNWTKRGLSPTEVIESHVGTVIKESNAADEALPFNNGIIYGDTENQKMDILFPDSLPRDCPIFIYIHGGYWQMMGRECSHFMAQPIHQAGGAVVVIGYDLAPKVTLPEIIEQVKRGVQYVLNMAKRRESRGVYIAGHSAGGQLAAVMLAVNWLNEAHISPGLVKGAVLVSGVFDLAPLLQVSEIEPLKLNQETVLSCSPFNNISKINKKAKILIVAGSDESPEFIRQSKEFHQVLQKEGFISSYIEMPNEDHFTVIERLCQVEYPLTQEVLKFMELKME